MNAQEIVRALDWRYAVKRFDPQKKISDHDWEILAESLVKAPSSYGLQPWKFLLVKDPSIRSQLKPASWNQDQVIDASHFVVFLTKERISEADVDEYLSDMARTRNVEASALSGFRNMLMTNVVRGKSAEETLNWTQRQAYIAMGFLLETAALLGVDTVPMEGLDPAAYDRILGLEGTGWKTVAAVALGYRHPEDQLQFAKKVRFPAEKIIQIV